MDLREVKAMVFDLDGTLYEDTHHFKYYAERIMNKLPQNIHNTFMAEYENAVEGNHTLKVGRIYDVEKDYILVHDNGNVTKIYNWQGGIISDALIAELYPSAIEIEMMRFISVGDLWWVPGCIGIHYGLTKPIIHSCFLETREYMMTPEFVMQPVEGFKELLEDISLSHKLVLLTNSPQPDSDTILEKLGIKNLFHKKIFRAKKPTMTTERFKEISAELEVHFNEILSVGDNLINDILPAKKLGCKTIYIDTHDIGRKEDADEVVKSIPEMVRILSAII